MLRGIFRIGLILVIGIFIGIPAALARNDAEDILKTKRVLYVPLDDRPVSLDYVTDTFKHMPIQYTPAPKNLLSHRTIPGNVDSLWEWVRSEAGATNVMVIAADSLVYGGLVPSRRHEIDQATLEARMDRFRELKKANPSLQIYLYTTVMRTPRASAGGTEPDYYEQYGPQIFRLTQLLDMKDRGEMNEAVQSELEALEKAIPEGIREDWFQRRLVNQKINERWIEWAKEGFVDYLIVCRDDSAEYSQSQREWRALKPLAAGLSETRFHAFPGTDEVGMLLLTRAVNELTFKTPQINVVYAPGVGGKTVPSYEDQPVDENIKAHIYAMGGFPALSPDTADMVLLVNTPYDGKTLEASNPINRPRPNRNHRRMMRQIVKGDLSGKPIAIADIAYGNGADRGLMKALEDNKLLYQIKGYSGWNTAGNSIGYSLSQGFLGTHYLNSEQTASLLSIRYLDDWAYQSQIRNEMYQTVVWPKQMNGSGLGDFSNFYMQSRIKFEMRDFIDAHLRHAGAPNEVEIVDTILPWQRMFEVFPVIIEVPEI